MRGAVALLVAVPAGAGLLALPPHLHQAVGYRQHAVVRVLRLAAPARVVADVEPRHVVHREGAHGVAEIDHHLVDLVRQRALLHHQVLFHGEAYAAAVGGKAVAIAGIGADLADGAAELHRRGQRLRRGLCPLHHLEQLHHVGRREVVCPRHRLRPLRHAGDLVDVDRRGVGEQQRAGLHVGVELAEHLLLHRDLLEHGLDHHVAVGDVGIAGDRLDQRQAPVHFRLGEAAALHADRVVVADLLHAALQALGRRVHQLHRDAHIGEAHGDAAAHGAGADHGHGPDLGQRQVLRQVRQLRHLALGEEGVAQRLRLLGVLELVEEPSLLGEALAEG